MYIVARDTSSNGRGRHLSAYRTVHGYVAVTKYRVYTEKCRMSQTLSLDAIKDI